MSWLKKHEKSKQTFKKIIPHHDNFGQRLSNDLESVGGEIDVAIISKSDGFIWKKKKDYFKHDLNPQINEKT